MFDNFSNWICCKKKDRSFRKKWLIWQHSLSLSLCLSQSGLSGTTVPPSFQLPPAPIVCAYKEASSRVASVSRRIASYRNVRLYVRYNPNKHIVLSATVWSGLGRSPSSLPFPVPVPPLFQLATHCRTRCTFLSVCVNCWRRCSCVEWGWGLENVERTGKIRRQKARATCWGKVASCQLQSEAGTVIHSCPSVLFSPLQLQVETEARLEGCLWIWRANVQHTWVSSWLMWS